jgi:hypothetical protein
MTETLAEKPCRGGIPPLARDEALRFQKQAPDWELRDDARCDPFARDLALDPGRASAPRITVPHMLPSSE